jgi:hypothetical protein
MSRLNNEQYNDFIPIRDENNSSSQLDDDNLSPRIESQPANKTANDTNTRLKVDPIGFGLENVSLEDFVRLEAIFRLLESFVSCRFLCISSINHSFGYVIQHHISRFNIDELFNDNTPPNNSSTIIQNWKIAVVDSLQETLRDIEHKHRHRIRQSDIQQAEQEINNFQQRLNESFESLESITANLVVENYKEPPNQQIRDICIRTVEGEHSRAKKWLEYFSEYCEISKRADLLFKNAESPYKLRLDPSDKPGFQLTTEVLDNYPKRIILLTFSLKNLFLQDFFLLAFKFFHEYVSHISACIVDGNVKKITDIDSYAKVATVFKDGWLIHTIEAFFENQSERLLQLSDDPEDNFSDLSHLEQKIRDEIRKYTQNLRDDQGKNYVAEFNKGYGLAEDFLNFLDKNITDKIQEEIRRLYYQLSFDLIQRCPDEDFSQEKFVDCIEYYLKCDQHKSYLLKVVRESLISDDFLDYLCIEIFWSKIRDAPFEMKFPER